MYATNVSDAEVSHGLIGSGVDDTSEKTLPTYTDLNTAFHTLFEEHEAHYECHAKLG